MDKGSPVIIVITKIGILFCLTISQIYIVVVTVIISAQYPEMKKFKYNKLSPTSPKDGDKIQYVHKKKIYIGTNIIKIFFLPIESAKIYEVQEPIIIPI